MFELLTARNLFIPRPIGEFTAEQYRFARIFGTLAADKDQYRLRAHLDATKKLSSVRTAVRVSILTLLSVTTTNAERPKYLSLTGFIWGIGTVLGPVVGGSLGDSSATWRWAFYLNLLVGVVIGPIYVLLLPDFKPQAGVPLTNRLAQIDYIGTSSRPYCSWYVQISC